MDSTDTGHMDNMGNTGSKGNTGSMDKVDGTHNHIVIALINYQEIHQEMGYLYCQTLFQFHL